MSSGWFFLTSVMLMTGTAGGVVSATTLEEQDASKRQQVVGAASTAKPGKAAASLKANGVILPRFSEYPNDHGAVGLYNEDGPVDMSTHPFFQPLEESGRTCASCHRPEDGMSLTAASARKLWEETDGKDPLFDMSDGANCPTLPASDPKSHSLLLERGLIRIARPWPPVRDDGSVIEPEFDIEVVRDPTTCNLDKTYGIASASPTISVYRRSRAIGNFKHVLIDYNDPPHIGFRNFRFLPKGMEEAFPLDPATGRMLNPNLMWDGRFSMLNNQAENAALVHQSVGKMTDEQLAAIIKFQNQIYIAQSSSNVIGRFPEGKIPSLGPVAIANAKPTLSSGDHHFGFSPTAWADADGKSDVQNKFRQSVMRGYRLFNKPFLVSDVQHITSNGLGNPTKRSCALCHVVTMTGIDSQSGWIDLGTHNRPWAADDPELPLFKITCKPGFQPHTFLGRVIYTSDPGRALVSGKCYDVGALVTAQLRALASRAPYFSNGSAASLREVTDFYDRRWNLHFSEQDKEDLVNFLGVL